MAPLVGGVHEDVVSVHLELRLEGHAAYGARRRRVHPFVHRLDVDIDAALAPTLQAIAIALAGIGLCPHDRVVVLRFACLGQLEGVCGASQDDWLRMHASVAR